MPSEREYALVKVFMGTHSREPLSSTTVGRQMLFRDSGIGAAIRILLGEHTDENGHDARIEQRLSYLDRTGAWVSHTVVALVEETAACTDDRYAGLDGTVRIVWHDNSGRVLYDFGAAGPGAAIDCAVLCSVRGLMHEVPSVRIELAMRCVLGPRQNPATFVHVAWLYEKSLFGALKLFSAQQGPGFDLADYTVHYQDAERRYVDLLDATPADCQRFCASGVCRLRISPRETSAAESLFCARFSGIDAAPELRVSVFRN